MQYFSKGYRPGDPRIRPAVEGRRAEQGPLPAQVDVLIVGSGPAGLVLAAQLSEFPESVTRVVERADGPLQVGRADGVSCRVVEMFNVLPGGLQGPAGDPIHIARPDDVVGQDHATVAAGYRRRRSTGTIQCGLRSRSSHLAGVAMMTRVESSELTDTGPEPLASAVAGGR